MKIHVYHLALIVKFWLVQVVMDLLIVFSLLLLRSNVGINVASATTKQELQTTLETIVRLFACLYAQNQVWRELGLSGLIIITLLAF